MLPRPAVSRSSSLRGASPGRVNRLLPAFGALILIGLSLHGLTYRNGNTGASSLSDVRGPTAAHAAVDDEILGGSTNTAFNGDVSREAESHARAAMALREEQAAHERDNLATSKLLQQNPAADDARRLVDDHADRAAEEDRSLGTTTQREAAKQIQSSTDASSQIDAQQRTTESGQQGVGNSPQTEAGTLGTTERGNSLSRSVPGPVQQLGTAFRSTESGASSAGDVTVRTGEEGTSLGVSSRTGGSEGASAVPTTVSEASGRSASQSTAQPSGSTVEGGRSGVAGVSRPSTGASTEGASDSASHSLAGSGTSTADARTSTPGTDRQGATSSTGDAAADAASSGTQADNSITTSTRGSTRGSDRFNGKGSDEAGNTGSQMSNATRNRDDAVTPVIKDSAVVPGSKLSEKDAQKENEEQQAAGGGPSSAE